MLKFDNYIPIKETYAKIASYPRFSLIEKIAPKFYPTSLDASLAVARVIKNQIEAKNKKGETCVLGLATGSTPTRVYRELIRMHKEEGLSFKNVVTFNLDEYYPIKNDDHQSYNYYMNHHLFNHIDIPKENINIPNGEIQRSSVTEYCQAYENKIKGYGGIDLQILGIGRTGHIGFNEPPSPINSITRLVYLHRLTRKDAAPSFGSIDKVPKCAITMGISTIRKAKKIIIMAWSESKAYIVKRSIEGQLTNEIPSTFLHQHEDAIFYLDKAAGEQLSRFHIPWTIKGDSQDPFFPHTPYWILKCVTWLSQKISKPILRLTYDDYEDHHLSQLVVDCAKGSVQDLNLYCYKKIISKITGWPLGNRPEDKMEGEKTSEIAKRVNKAEKVLIFSPHPDDDVISMGGTIKKLVEQGHDVHIAYMTSGTNAVFDHDAKKYLYFLQSFSKEYFWTIQKDNKGTGESKPMLDYLHTIAENISNIQSQKSELIRSDFITQTKKFIRSSQAKIAINHIGVDSKNAYCLDLPFYYSHSKHATEADYEQVRSLLRLIEPTAIYAAGDLTDPHGTHRKCLKIIFKLYQDDCMRADKNEKSLFPQPNHIFLYRGAWEEWSIPMARVIVPLSPKDVEQKISSILRHQSQKDTPMFPGDDKRQFWLRVKERNRNTADLLNKLGFPDYEAAQCFVNIQDFIQYDEIQ